MFKRYLLIPFILFSTGQAFALPDCPADQNQRWHNCFGTYNDPNVGKYIGEWRDNKRNGQGTLIFVWTGAIYVGEFRNNMMHGQGTETFPDGRKYSGEWRDSIAHGQGTLIFPDEFKYVGEFRDGKRHGQGTMTTVSGRVQEGLWIDGEFQDE